MKFLDYHLSQLINLSWTGNIQGHHFRFPSGVAMAPLIFQSQKLKEKCTATIYSIGVYKLIWITLSQYKIIFQQFQILLWKYTNIRPIHNKTGYLLDFPLPNLSTNASKFNFFTKLVSVHMTSRFESRLPPIVPRMYVLTLFKAGKNLSVEADVTGSVIAVWINWSNWSKAAGNTIIFLTISWKLNLGVQPDWILTFFCRLCLAF